MPIPLPLSSKEGIRVGEEEEEEEGGDLTVIQVDASHYTHTCYRRQSFSSSPPKTLAGQGRDRR